MVKMRKQDRTLYSTEIRQRRCQDTMDAIRPRSGCPSSCLTKRAASPGMSEQTKEGEADARPISRTHSFHAQLSYRHHALRCSTDDTHAK